MHHSGVCSAQPMPNSCSHVLAPPCSISLCCTTVMESCLLAPCWLQGCPGTLQQGLGLWMGNGFSGKDHNLGGVWWCLFECTACVNAQPAHTGFIWGFGIIERKKITEKWIKLNPPFIPFIFQLEGMERFELTCWSTLVIWGDDDCGHGRDLSVG